jgi:hypothetical protein
MDVSQPLERPRVEHFPFIRVQADKVVTRVPNFMMKLDQGSIWHDVRVRAWD